MRTLRQLSHPPKSLAVSGDQFLSIVAHFQTHPPVLHFVELGGVWGGAADSCLLCQLAPRQILSTGSTSGDGFPPCCLPHGCSGHAAGRAAQGHQHRPQEPLLRSASPRGFYV